MAKVFNGVVWVGGAALIVGAITNPAALAVVGQSAAHSIGAGAGLVEHALT